MIARTGRKIMRTINLGLLKAHGVKIGTGVVLHGRPIVSMANGSDITVGSAVVLTSDPRMTALGVGRPCILRTLGQGATIEIGSDSGLSGVTICAARSVFIGQRVLVGADVMIADTDFHPLDTVPRRYEPIPTGRGHDAVRIEDDVFIGARSIVLKGVTIGAGSVIGAGSLVTSDIPSNSVAAGVPARVLRPLNNSRVDERP